MSDTRTVYYELTSLTPVAGWRAVYRPLEGDVIALPIFALATAKVTSQEFDYRGHAQGPRKEEPSEVVGVRFNVRGSPQQFEVVNADARFVGLLAPENNLASFCRAHGLPTPGAA